MSLSPAAKKLILLGGVALTLHTGSLFIKPIVAPEKKKNEEVLQKLKNI